MLLDLKSIILKADLFVGVLLPLLLLFAWGSEPAEVKEGFIY